MPDFPVVASGREAGWGLKPVTGRIFVVTATLHPGAGVAVIVGVVSALLSAAVPGLSAAL